MQDNGRLVRWHHGWFPLFWAPLNIKQDASKNIDTDGALALAGCHCTRQCNNPPNMARHNLRTKRFGVVLDGKEARPRPGWSAWGWGGVWSHRLGRDEWNEEKKRRSSHSRTLRKKEGTLHTPPSMIHTTIPVKSYKRCNK